MIIMNKLLLNPAETFGMKQKLTFFPPVVMCVCGWNGLWNERKCWVGLDFA